MATIDHDVQGMLRALAPEVLGIVVRRWRDLPAAEDAVQEALISAASSWRKGGVPESPKGWLIHVATRRLTDAVRAEAARRHREALVVSLIPLDEQVALAADEATPARDDTLDLLFMCCHPALTPASAIALTLRAVGGLGTAEIARAFLVPEPTMAQRISRAKQAIRAAGSAFQIPTELERRERLRHVMRVLYLMFSEGYSASEGAVLARTDLSDEAIRIARLLRSHMPAEPEVMGLLALMLLTDARRPARTGPSGELVPLDEQDRGVWDRAAIAEGVALLEDALPRGAPGPFQVQAAIAAVHDEAESTDATDWQQIVELYEVLLAIEENPMARLSQAVARSMVDGPAAGLVHLAALDSDPRIAGHYRLDAVRGHLYERAGDRAAASAAYRLAAEGTASAAERNYLLLKAARLS